MGGEQAIRFDIPGRRFVFFGSTFWATDTLPLMFFLAGLGLCLFFFTSLFGRVWCGWACPQTIFLEFLFRPIETLIEGNASQRKKLDESPWSTNKIARKSIKFLVFVALAWLIANTFLAYFVGREPLLEMMSHLPTANLGVFLVSVAVMGLVLFEFGWFREQFCTVLCPYARFQSVLTDEDSLVIGYDANRGEPRGKLERNSEAKTRGDCVDCALCVKVCPTGIDIRNGLQLECVQCTACIDACNSVMVKINRPTGLIRYDSVRGLQSARLRLVRPRTILYAALLAGYIALFCYSLASREHAEFQFIRAPRTTFTEITPGQITNQIEVHISNKDSRPHSYSVRAAKGSLELELRVPLDPFPIEAGRTTVLPLFVSLTSELLSAGEYHCTFEVFEDGRSIGQRTFTLIGPRLAKPT